MMVGTADGTGGPLCGKDAFAIDHQVVGYARFVKRCFELLFDAGIRRAAIYDWFLCFDAAAEPRRAL